jgi:hypothetical protein
LPRFATRFVREGDNLIWPATKTPQKKLKPMTKVIAPRSDETGGCKQTHPKVADAEAAFNPGAAGWTAARHPEKELIPWPSVF